MNFTWMSVAALAAGVFVLMFCGTFSGHTEPDGNQDIEKLRGEAAAAMKDLRYRDALNFLEQIEKAGKASFDDRNNTLTCLLKLREDEEFQKRLQGFMGAEKDLFLKGRYGRLLISKLESDGYYDHYARLRELYQDVHSWIKSGASTAEQKGILADFLFQYMDFIRWDREYEYEKQIVALADEVLELNVDAERNGKALLTKAEMFEDDPRTFGKSFDQIVEAFREVVRRFPTSEAAVTAQFRLGEIFRNRSEYLKAITEFEQMKKLRPSHKLAEAAAEQIAEIKRPRLQVQIEEVFKPGGKPFLEIRYRNIGKIDFAAYRFDLMSNLREYKALERIHESIDPSGMEPQAGWSFDTDDKGEHQWHSSRIDVPITESGAFIVRSTGGGVENRALLLISGLALVVKSSSGKAHTYCADAVSGEPVRGADILVATGYDYDRPADDSFVPYNERKYYFHRFFDGRSDESGLWVLDMDQTIDSGDLLVMARNGEDFALSEGYLGYWWREAKEGTKIYAYTDRPVYRPGQRVHYKAIVRTWENGVYKNLPKRQVLVMIQDALDQTVRQEKLTTNEFGSVTGELLVGENQPLGAWSIQFRIGDEYTYTSFRVEEYKKPEFKVSVTPEETQYRLGGRVAATINARYYFGEPVVGAQVEYEVRQNQSWWWYRTPDPYGWFYGDERDYEYDYYYYGGRIVHKGTGETDEEGNLRISLPTQPLPNDDRDIKVYNFVISAQVTDASRRMIEGSGSTKVSSHEFSVGIHSDRYVYGPGDRVSVEMTAMRFDGRPRASEGKLVLYRAEWNSARRDYALTKTWETAASTGEDGKGRSELKVEGEGYFFIQYETVDIYDKVITGRTAVWVTKADSQIKFFPKGTLEIVPDKEHYFLGDTAKLLINSQLDNAYGLFTVEANEILEARIVPLRQGANLVELPIVEAYEPNIYVKVHVVKDFALHTESKELLVPPEEKFAAITITPSKSEFKPGESGTITVEAKDWKGVPLEAEFSIGVVDTAIYYIAPDTTADIRAFFFGTKRYDSVRLFSSFEFRFRGVEEEAKEKDMAAESGAPRLAMKAEGEAAPEPSNGDEKKADLVEPEIRKEFKDSALWLADVRTDADGKATVEVQWPDNLTTWRTTVRAVTKDTVVGNTLGDTVVRKNLLVRLQTPRFLVQGDKVTLSVNVHNYLAEAKRAKVSIEAEGLTIRGEAERWVEVASRGEARFDVEALAENPGTAKVLAKALTDEESDAMELSLPVYIHGIEKFAAAAGSVERSREIELNLPSEIKPGSAVLKLNVRPTIAGAMLDSLPYLIDYPYGCTEQTMSRFLPAAMVAKTLRDLGLKRPELDEKLPDVIKKGLERLYDFQHADGGWGWWKHDDTNIHMTAYVVYGLTVAQQADIVVDQDRLRRGIKFLRQSLANLEDKVELLNFVLYTLSWSNSVPERYLNRVFDLLPKMRDYETALFAVTLHNLKKPDRFAEVVERLETLARIDDEQGIAAWGKEGGWYWYEDNVEATSLALMAELRKDPEGDIIKKIVRWLLSVRKGGKWKSTRDTAYAIYALTEFIKISDEFNPDLTVTVDVDGKEVKKVRFTRGNLFSDDGVLELRGDALKPGAQRMRITKEGQGNLYYDAFLTYFSLEEHISAASTTIAVERSYARIKRSVDSEGKEVIHRTPLKEGEPLVSGEEIEVRLKLTSKNNYEYLVYEDFKPAGCEPLRLRSGYTYGIASNMELRDEKVVFFIGYLPEGTHELTYELRAEIPGLFHALPTNGYAMYAPDVRAISDEFVMPIRDLGETKTAN
jgi:uncharacterized protein YfaS (alpha-2-macroglobulin family)/tetratricopeptide (TPR) repeat protein